jgi:SAM-dependent methyltransferase
MASSWYAQIPTILTLVRELQPKSILDVGKGLGKYGLLIQEYFGIDDRCAPDPTRRVVEQSRLILDAVESEPNFLWPHLQHFYRKVFVGRVENLLESLPTYDLVLMIDVIEHIEKKSARDVVERFLAQDSVVVVSSPTKFFYQDNFGSADEAHVSHWTKKDFRFCSSQWQRVGSSSIYVLSRQPLRLRTFGRSFFRGFKRIVHALDDELLLDESFLTHLSRRFTT